jgi:hypothetical protein
VTGHTASTRAPVSKLRPVLRAVPKSHEDPWVLRRTPVSPRMVSYYIKQPKRDRFWPKERALRATLGCLLARPFAKDGAQLAQRYFSRHGGHALVADATVQLRNRPSCTGTLRRPLLQHILSTLGHGRRRKMRAEPACAFGSYTRFSSPSAAGYPLWISCVSTLELRYDVSR